jgi:hypothetical protein
LSSIDFVVDAQDLPRTYTHSDLRAAFQVCDDVRTWSVVAGTFPQGITHLSPDQYEHAQDRDEWLVWCEEVLGAQGNRLPLYGDFATQSAIYSVSPSFPGSPSVRYSTGTKFIVLRGRGSAAGDTVDYSQYIGHARYLRSRKYFRDFVGTGADGYVERIALGTNGTGNQTTWRLASLGRHLELVAAQMTSYVPALIASGSLPPSRASR